jgi:cell division protein FtsB
MEALVSALLAAGITVGWLQPKIKKQANDIEQLKDTQVELVEQMAKVDTQMLAKTVALITPVAQATAQLKQTIGV